MRIAFVTETYPPEINGVSLTVARCIAHLRAAGHQVDLLRPRQAGERAGDVWDGDDGGPEWHSSGFPIPVYRDMRFGVSRWQPIAQRLLATRAQLVHVATEGPLGWAAVAAAARLGLPATSDFRTRFDRYLAFYRLGFAAPLARRYLRAFHNRTLCTFVPTRELGRELLADGYRRIEVIGRGVDNRRFSPRHRSAALRESWGVGEDDPVLLYVGRIAPEKNLELAVQAYRELRRARPGARMVVVGDGPARERLQGAHPELLFTGLLSGARLAAHYASADVFLFPSRTDTFGNVTLEALASGLPVVAFSTGAAAEHVHHGISGALADDDDRRFVAEACALAARAPREREAMGVQSRLAALRVDWRVVLDRFEERLAKLHDESASRSAVLATAPRTASRAAQTT